MQSHSGGLFSHVGIGRPEVILYHSIQNGVLDGFFEYSDFPAGTDSECLHYIFACDRVLPVAQGILLFHLIHFPPHEFEIVSEPLDLSGILGCDVCIAQEHQVF